LVFWLADLCPSHFPGSAGKQKSHLMKLNETGAPGTPLAGQNSTGEFTCEVSVIVPTFNRRDSLRRLLESLLRQTLSPARYQVIVVSDGSTDDTMKMVLEMKGNFPNLEVLDLANRGPAAARNSGANAASGRCLAFTDDDCVASQDWLEQLLLVFQRTGAVAVQGKTTTDRSACTPLTHQMEVARPWPSAMPSCNAAYLKSVFDKVGGFDETFKFAHNEDADLAWRAEEYGKIVYAPDVHIIHPPRNDGFFKIARRVRLFECDFLLFNKQRVKYKKYISPSPWWTIYWKIFVVQQLRDLKSNCRYLVKSFKPLHFSIGLSLIFAQWFYLVRYFPAYLDAQRLYSPRPNSR
jgi:GT2 family glycosyltransferase